MELKNITPRDYQQEIFETTKEKNTLVCLPTGTGKTINIILLALYRLNKIKDSKIAIVSPTKPLNAQHLKTFKDHTTIDPDEIVLLTGALNPEKRKSLYNKKVIIATPQTLKEDLINNRFSFKNFSLLGIDEAHRAIGQYAYTHLANQYLQQSEFPRILALTASPGSTKEKINEICKNLYIEAVEIRTEEDLKDHIQKKEIRWVTVELPQELKQLHTKIKQVYNIKLKTLKNLGFTKPPSLITKKDLLQLQHQFRKEIEKRNPLGYHGVSLTAQLIKLNHALELLETQGLSQLKEFLTKLKTEDTRSSKAIIKEKNIIEAIKTTEKLLKENIQHPKLIKLCEIVKEELKQDPNARIIIFANYRNTIAGIVSELKKLGIKAERFVGQSDKADKGLKQKEQIEMIRKFKDGEFNILASSQVAEEGIDIVETNAVIFFEPIASELRKVQRAGRTARTKPGKIVFLITKGTRDEAYYWASHRKEKIMKKTLYKMQEDQNPLNKTW